MYRETAAGLDHPDCVLQSVLIQADLHETLARVSTTHRYINSGTANIEAVYIFPLSIDAVLLDMNLVVGNRTLTGQIFPKKQAEDRYEDAVVEGDLPAMLQNPAPGFYCLNIANIQPGEHVTVSFTYGLFLSWQGHDLRFAIPTTIAPRYGGPEQAGLVEHQVPETDFLAENQYDLSIVVHGRLSSAKISSPSHDIRVQFEDGGARVCLARSGAWMDRDFVLTLSVPETGPSSLMWDQDEDTHLLWACFNPDTGIRSDTVSHGLILVVDCSRSMNGDSIGQARHASRSILDSLRAGDYFNILRFGSEYQTLFRRMKPANQDNLEDARDYIDQMNADLGGTELQKALAAALKMSCNPLEPVDILLITDGEVYSIDGVIRQAAKSKRRIFPIGVGSAPAESNLKQMAVKSGGACEFVFPGESMTEKIMRQFRRMRAGTIHIEKDRSLYSRLRRMYAGAIPHIGMIWPATPIRHYPDRLCTLFDGDTVHMFGWFDSRPNGGDVGLKLTLAGGQDLTISAGDVSTAGACATPGLIARMAAALQLADMTDTDAATRLAVTYQLVSKYTHCLAIAVQAEGEKAENLPELVRVKQMMAAGWGGSGRILAKDKIQYSVFYNMEEPFFRRKILPLSPSEKDALESTSDDLLDFEDLFLEELIPPPSFIKASPRLWKFAEYLNRYDIHSDPGLLFIADYLPKAIREAIEDLNVDLADSSISDEDILTVFLHLFIKSDYGSQLNRNLTRIIKKRFKEANLSKQLVQQIREKIEPLLRDRDDV